MKQVDCDPGFQNCTTVVTVFGFVRLRWNFEAIRVQPPVISNFTVELHQLNGCPGGTVRFFRWSFDYFDPNGNVPNPVATNFTNLWLPTQRGTSVQVSLQREGTGTQGRVSAISSLTFDINGVPDDQLQQTIFITDVAGLRSNSISAIIQRPGMYEATQVRRQRGHSRNARTHPFATHLSEFRHGVRRRW